MLQPVESYFESVGCRLWTVDLSRVHSCLLSSDCWDRHSWPWEVSKSIFDINVSLNEYKNVNLSLSFMATERSHCPECWWAHTWSMMANLRPSIRFIWTNIKPSIWTSYQGKYDVYTKYLTPSSQLRVNSKSGWYLTKVKTEAEAKCWWCGRAASHNIWGKETADQAHFSPCSRQHVDTPYWFCDPSL